MRISSVGGLSLWGDGGETNDLKSIYSVKWYVGIGWTTPDDKLVVAGSVGINWLRIASGDNVASFTLNNSGYGSLTLNRGTGWATIGDPNQRMNLSVWGGMNCLIGSGTGLTVMYLLLEKII